jgi:site-specific DNA-methyltransferase (adenine-specific)
MSVICGDSLHVLPTLDAESVDAIVCDPPYGLSFMGKDWDHGVPGEAFWREALRVAKPGAHLVAFGGTRTWHRLAVAIEDSGWEIRDNLCWLFGSGFPKSHNGPWGGTALKPAHEPVILARKPLIGTVAANVAQYGTGGINVDGCRLTPVGAVQDKGRGRNELGQSQGWNAHQNRNTPYDGTQGRWPANVVLDEEAAGMLDAQTGITASTDRPRNNGAFKSVAKGAETARVSFGHSDSGGASRFFYTAKASRKEREAGLEGMDGRKQGQRYGNVQDARPHTSEGYEYSRKPTSNHHPTVKPIALMRWLCRLVTPKGGLILDPFTGSGTTGCAAVLEGFRFVGVEREPEYAAIAEKRIAHWAAQTPDADLFTEAQ